MQQKRLGAAAVILNAEGHVLLVKHDYGHYNWELPGGSAELGESIVETALREVKEETGLDVTAEQTTGIYYETALDMLHFVFLCRCPSPHVANLSDESAQSDFQPNSEISAWAYWPSSALPRPISNFTIQRIHDALSGTVHPVPVVIGSRLWLE